ncbi:MAG: 50S ribosomal protein L20 [bacterium]
MTRVTNGPAKRARHNKVLARTSGFRMSKNRLWKVAHESYLHALDYAFTGRKNRKRDFRVMWNIRLNAGLRAIDATYTYSKFICDAKKACVTINRKLMAHLAVTDTNAFKAVVDTVRK